jgi:hypothetical protein
LSGGESEHEESGDEESEDEEWEDECTGEESGTEELKVHESDLKPICNTSGVEGLDGLSIWSSTAILFVIDLLYGRDKSIRLLLTIVVTGIVLMMAYWIFLDIASK